MDFRLIRRLTADKLAEPSTYVVAAIVGTLINGYGQLLVPWFRGWANPFEALTGELVARPGLTLFSIFLAYAFPLCVGVYSSVATRYWTRRFESIADFPDRKPDPVFRADPGGRIVEIGAATRAFFETYGIKTAQQILGDTAWAEIRSAMTPGHGRRIYFEAEGADYAVSHAPTENQAINVYLTRLAA